MTGNELRKWRKERHMTQNQAADYFGFSRGTYANWEAGNASPKAANKARLQAKMAADAPVARQAAPKGQGLLYDIVYSAVQAGVQAGVAMVMQKRELAYAAL